ncbi:class I SAM-dependent methyltransferase [Candidatus Woesearchaeota archaeon]|nr:class I SAM-dependent methyltransferase [Candidatus Woesearchaeota archaeon]
MVDKIQYESFNRHRVVDIANTSLVVRLLGEYIKPGCIIDLGSGPGDQVALWNAKDAGSVKNDVICVDITPFNLTHIKKMGFKAVRHDLQCFPYPFENKSADTIISFCVIAHLKNYFDYLQECLRILKDDGVLLFKAPNAKLELNQNHYYHFEERALIKTLERVGFTRFKAVYPGFKNMFFTKIKQKLPILNRWGTKRIFLVVQK